MIKELQREIKGKIFQAKSQNPELVIEKFKTNILSNLGNMIKGIYIIGSYGLNDFNQNLSDIDFIVTIEKELTDKQTEIIKSIHLEIERETIQPNLNGIYILENQLGKTSKEIDRLTYFHEGELKTDYNKSNYYEINPITWSELKLSGVTIYGKKREEIEIKLDWEKIDKYLHENINSYWKRWLIASKNYFHPYYYMTLIRRGDNEWCVSGVARQLYTLKEHKITSKRKACEYLMDKVPGKHLKILRDAIGYRKGIRTRRSWKQKDETLKFLNYSINRFNEIYEEKYGS